MKSYTPKYRPPPPPPPPSPPCVTLCPHDGDASFKDMAADPSLFDAYHAG
jgi:hypothetical protein